MATGNVRRVFGGFLLGVIAIFSTASIAGTATSLTSEPDLRDVVFYIHAVDTTDYVPAFNMPEIVAVPARAEKRHQVNVIDLPMLKPQVLAPFAEGLARTTRAFHRFV